MAAPADLVIRGAGPVGCALAAALRYSGLSVALQAQSRTSPPGMRPIALSYASRLILERVGAWQDLAVTPITRVHVSQAGGFGRVLLDAADARVPELGYVVGYAALAERLAGVASYALVDEAPPARWRVHAEGWSEAAREKDYGQHALVGWVETRPGPSGTAFERFTPEGPLALLPCQGRYAMVWSTSPGRARALCEASPADFLRALALATGGISGTPIAVEARATQPLALRVRRSRVEGSEVFIGNAAQTLHPVAGQGLNLGLRDAWDLAQALRDAGVSRAGAALERYAASRRLDAGATILVTDTLAAAFLGSGRMASAARGAALAALDILPGARTFLARRMIFGTSALP